MIVFSHTSYWKGIPRRPARRSAFRKGNLVPEFVRAAIARRSSVLAVAIAGEVTVYPTRGAARSAYRRTVDGKQ